MATVVAITQAEATIAVVGTPAAGYGRIGVNSVNSHLIFVDSAGNVTDLTPVPGAISVVAAAVIADHTIVRGDGGGYGVQDSTVIIDDADNVSGIVGLTMTGAIGTPTGLTMGGNVDLDGNDLLLSADGNTYIHSPVNNVTELVCPTAAGEFSVNVNGAIDFRFQANTFGVEPGSAISLANNTCWLGLAAGAGRFVFDSAPAPDQIQVNAANLCLLNGVELRWYDVGNSNFIAVEAPALTADATYVWPATETDGCLYNTSGTLSWAIAKWVGTSFLGGDLTGNVRGANALDIQSNRGAATEVASGAGAVAVGTDNTAGGPTGITVGINNTASGGYSSQAFGDSNTSSGNASFTAGAGNTASGDQASAVGYGTIASGDDSSTFGRAGTASAHQSTAIGYEPEARIQYTTNICGPQIIRKDDGEGAAAAFYSFCGTEVILMSAEVDLEAVADQTITLPANCKFWLNEIGLICTSLVALTTQPTIRFGITGNLAKHHVAAITTDLTAAGKREIETPLVPEDGETSLTAGVTIAATATTMLGRFYWKGMLVEDE